MLPAIVIEHMKPKVKSQMDGTGAFNKSLQFLFTILRTLSPETSAVNQSTAQQLQNASNTIEHHRITSNTIEQHPTPSNQSTAHRTTSNA